MGTPPPPSILYDLEYIEERIKLGLEENLIDEYNLCISNLQDEKEDNANHIAKLTHFKTFLKNNLHVLRKYPEALLNLALNEPEGSPITIEATNQRSSPKYATQKLLLLQNKKAKGSIEGLTLEHSDNVLGAFIEGDLIVTFVSRTCCTVWNLLGKKLREIPCEGGTLLPGTGRVVLHVGNHVELFDIKTGDQLAKSEEKFTSIFIKMQVINNNYLVAITGTGDTHTRKVVDSNTLQLFDVEQSGGVSKFLSTILESPPVRFVLDTSNGKLSNDAKYMFSAPDGTALYMWDVEYDKEVAVVEAHSKHVMHYAISPVGAKLATSSLDATTKIWDFSSPPSLNLIRTFTHDIKADHCTFSPDGNKLVTAALLTIAVWDITTGHKIASFNNHSLSIFHLGFSPDGSKILSGSGDRTARIWELTNAQELHEDKNAHTKQVSQCVVSSDGKYVATVSQDQTLKIWQQDGIFLHTFTHKHNWEPNVSFAPSGKFVLSIEGRNIYVYSIEEGKLTATLSHSQAVVFYLGEIMQFSAKGVLATFCGKEIKLWDSSNWNLLHTIGGHPGKIDGCVFSPDGNFVASSTDKKIGLTDISSGKTKTKFFTNDAGRLYAFTGQDAFFYSIDEFSRVKIPPPYPTNDVTYQIDHDDVPIRKIRYAAALGTYVVLRNLPEFSDLIALDFASGEWETLSKGEAGAEDFLSYEDELWSTYSNTGLIWYTKTKGIADIIGEAKFFVPKAVSALGRGGDLVACGTNDGDVYIFKTIL